MQADQVVRQMGARSTSGAHLEFRYDGRTNSVIVMESGWTETGRDAPSPGASWRQALRPADVVRFSRLPWRRNPG